MVPVVANVVLRPAIFDYFCLEVAAFFLYGRVLTWSGDGFFYARLAYF